jgi:hypothetical protein
MIGCQDEGLMLWQMVETLNPWVEQMTYQNAIESVTTPCHSYHERSEWRQPALLPLVEYRLWLLEW